MGTFADTPVYEERQSMQFRGLLTAVMVFAFTLAALMAPLNREQMIWTSALAGALVALFWMLMTFRIVITAREIRFGFPFWKKRILLEDVQVGGIHSITFWMGIGIHYSRRQWVYNARLGRGVHIRYGKRDYLVGSTDPERFQSVLLARAPRRGKR